MHNLDQMLNEVALKSAEGLSISLAVPEGLDVTKMKDILKEEVEKQLRNLYVKSFTKKRSSWDKLLRFFVMSGDLAGF